MLGKRLVLRISLALGLLTYAGLSLADTQVSAVSKIGKLAISMPASGQVSIATVRILRVSDGKVIKTVEDPAAEMQHPLMAGEYELVMGFANENYHDATEVSYGTWEVKGGETTSVTLGSLLLNVAPTLEKMVVEAVTLTGRDGGPAVTLHPHGNGYYLFKPKPVPAGHYDFSIHYYRSPSSTLVAENLAITAGEETVLTLDAGIIVKPPAADGVTGWDLIPAGGGAPLILARRGWDNQEPLWRVFAVPAGTYSVDLHLDGMDEPLRIGEGLSIGAGDLLEFDTGL